MNEQIQDSPAEILAAISGPAIAAIHAVARVRELHTVAPSSECRAGRCTHCRLEWPCDTIRAIDGVRPAVVAEPQREDVA